MRTLAALLRRLRDRWLFRGEASVAAGGAVSFRVLRVPSSASPAPDNVIRLRLDAKPGEKFDVSEIAACLDYTTTKAAATDSEA